MASSRWSSRSTASSRPRSHRRQRGAASRFTRSPPPAGPASPTTPASPSSSGTARPPTEAPLALPRSAPASIDIPAIDVHSSVIALGLDADGALAVPQPGPNLDKVAWYDGSVTPGEAGPSVLEGHVDSVYGPSVFFRLGAVRPGNRIVVTRADGSIAVFTVNAVRSYADPRRLPGTSGVRLRPGQPDAAPHHLQQLRQLDGPLRRQHGRLRPSHLHPGTAKEHTHERQAPHDRRPGGRRRPRALRMRRLQRRQRLPTRARRPHRDPPRAAGRLAVHRLAPSTTSDDMGGMGDMAMVDIEDFMYQGAMSVKPGQMVMVTNDDSEAHTLTSDDTGDVHRHRPTRRHRRCSTRRRSPAATPTTATSTRTCTAHWSSADRAISVVARLAVRP